MPGKPITIDEMLATLRQIVNGKVWSAEERARRTEVLYAIIGHIQIARVKVRDEDPEA